jgi:stage IV sporulation protein FB
MRQTKFLNFQLFGFPVQVDAYFFLMTVVLGSRGSNNLLLLIGWTAVVFVSILLHELGHAFVGRKYGHNPWIELYAGGGLTHGITEARAYTLYWRDLKVTSRSPVVENVAISLAGPAAGFVLGGLIWFFWQELGSIHASWYLRVIIWDLIWVNIGWGLLNLIPMLPLDGGNIMRAIVLHVRAGDERLPLQISVGVGVVVGVLALLSGSLWGALLCGWFTYQNYQRLQD